MPDVLVPDMLAALRHLSAYHAESSARAAGAWATGLTRLWADAVRHPPSPPQLADRALRWWDTVSRPEQPRWHTPHRVEARTPFAVLRDFTDPADDTAAAVPTIVLPPQAGHASSIVDFSATQSQVATIRAAGLRRLAAFEWLPATPATSDVTITDYLHAIDAAVETRGGRVNLVGDCQGGWLAAVYAALHPGKVNTLTLAGAPIDFHAGDSVLASSTRALAGAFDLAPYRALVALGGGNMPGDLLLANFLAIRPEAEIARQLDLLAHVDDPGHVARHRAFDGWFTHTQDVPGAFYLWLIEHLFHGNELVRGELVVDGTRADLAAVTCPLFLLAGADDHITPPPQVFAAAAAVGTPAGRVLTRTAKGGHLGLFMGGEALREDWPALLAGVREHSVS